jgi:hypothetical protein
MRTRRHIRWLPLFRTTVIVVLAMGASLHVMSFTDFIAYSSMALIAVGVYLEIEGNKPYKRGIGHVLTGISTAGLVYSGLVISGWLSDTSRAKPTVADNQWNYLGIIIAVCLLITLAIQLVMIAHFFRIKGRIIHFFAPAPVVKSTDTTSGLVTSIRPEVIIAEIRSRPPFERAIAAKKYEGITVEWSGRFYDLNMVGPEHAKLHIFCESKIDNWDPMITVLASLIEYPAIKILIPEAPIRMQGRIKSIAVPGAIELEDTKLFFD